MHLKTRNELKNTTVLNMYIFLSLAVNSTILCYKLKVHRDIKFCGFIIKLAEFFTLWCFNVYTINSLKDRQLKAQCVIFIKG